MNCTHCRIKLICRERQLYPGNFISLLELILCSERFKSQCGNDYELASLWLILTPAGHLAIYRGADKSLAPTGRKQALKHVRDARGYDNTETRDVIKFFFFLHAKAPKVIHAILTETLAFFLPGRAKDLSAPL